MQCPGCNIDNPDGAKFCSECGSKLSRVCPSCNTQTTPTAKFCAECGQDLQGSEQPKKIENTKTLTKESKIFTRRDELRIVTILFGDLKGFTALSEKLGPDEVKEITGECFGLLEKHISGQGGIVDKYMGDCVMALFGVPTAHEDDPVRAIRAALAMQQEVKNYSDRLKGKLGIPIEMRIGINTGKVLAGNIGKDFADFTVMGDAVNLASRLEKEAPPGGIVISGFSHKHVKDKFLFRSLGKIDIRGKEQKVLAFEVLAEIEEEQTLVREQEGIKAPIVGRNRELQRLSELLNQTANEKYPRIVTIFGPHGIGKTRLLREFSKSTEYRTTTSRCIENAMTAYSAMKGLVTQLANITQDDSEDVALAKLNDILSDYSQSAIILKLIGFFSDKKYEDISGQIALKALADLFTRAASKQPLILLVDDLHFADEGSLVSLTYLAMAIESSPIFILCAARDEQFSGKDTFCQNLPNYQKITLRPIGIEDSSEMLQNLMPGAEIPDKLVNLVIEQSQGNPHYIEEIIRDLIERKLIIKDEKGHFEIKDTTNIAVPPTLEGIIQARIDRLSLNERILLQEAAVQGKEFWEEPIHLLEKTADSSGFEGTPAPIPMRLKNLVHKEFVGLKTNSRISQCVEFAFLHSFTHDVIYGSIPGKQKRLYHSIIADWLSKIAERNPQALYGLIGFHYERSGNTSKASESYIQAAEYSRNAYDLSNSIMLYRNALRLITIDDTTEIRKTMAELLVLTGGFNEAITILQAIKTHDVHILTLLGQAEEGKGDYDKAIELYNSAKDGTTTMLPSTQSILRGKIVNGLVTIYIRRGENDKAIQGASKVLSTLDNFSTTVFAEVEPLTAQAHLLSGIAHYQKGLASQASEHYKRAHALYQALGDFTGLGKALNNLGNLELQEQNLQSAEKYYKQALEVAQKTGNLRERSNILNNIALVSRERYQFENAIKVQNEVIKIGQRMGDKWGIAASLINLALTYIDIGSSSDAIKTIERASEMELNRTDANWLWYENYIRATCLLMQEKPLDGLGHIAKCVELAEEMKSYTQTAWSNLLMVETRVSLNEWDLAQESLLKLKSYSGAPKEELNKSLLQARVNVEKGANNKAKEILDSIETKLTPYKELQMKFFSLKSRLEPDKQQIYANKARESVDYMASMLKSRKLRESFLSRPDIKQLVS